jgi:hypothetical protein
MRAGYSNSENRQLKQDLDVTRKTSSEVLPLGQALRIPLQGACKKLNYLLKAERWFHASPDFDRAGSTVPFIGEKNMRSLIFVEAI